MDEDCNGCIFYLFILSYRVRLSYLITALVLSLFFIYGCGLVILTRARYEAVQGHLSGAEPAEFDLK